VKAREETITYLSKEAERLYEANRLTREAFRALQGQGLAVKASPDELHGVLAFAPRAWYHDVFPR
jgi:hypothetical protein